MAAVHHYLLLPDAQVVLVALEFFYQLTLHADITERVVQLPGLVATIVSRVCFAPDQWMDQGAMPDSENRWQEKMRAIRRRGGGHWDP